MRRAFAAMALLLLVPGVSAAAGDHGFQLEMFALGSRPFGTYASGDRATDLFNHGGNLGGRVVFGVSRRLSVGVWAGQIENQKYFSGTTLLDSQVPLPVAGNRNLRAIPVMALGQLRSDTHRQLSVYAEAGAGLTTFNLRLTNLTLVGDFPFRPVIEPQSRFQQTLSFVLGAGGVLGLGRNLELVAGLDYLQCFARGGDIWDAGDSPAYALGTIGLRYPRW